MILMAIHNTPSAMMDELLKATLTVVLIGGTIILAIGVGIMIYDSVRLTKAIKEWKEQNDAELTRLREQEMRRYES